MSYDLMVFNPKKAPKDKTAFSNWYQVQTEWEEDHNYDDPKVSSLGLRNWFFEMIEAFPAMNGPYSSDDVDDPKVSDYSVGRDVIYVAFAWSEAEDAYSKMLELAKKHQIGFYDTSGSDEIIWPNENDKTSMKKTKKSWYKFW